MKAKLKRRSVVLFLVSMGIGAACGFSLSSSSEDQRPDKNVLTEHRPLIASKASKQLGENCTVYGRTECLSGICLHVGPDKNTGYFCSSTCSQREDCPSEWRCNQLHPGSGGSACVPPTGWAGMAATRAPSNR
jgi:hypothetical protein